MQIRDGLMLLLCCLNIHAMEEEEASGKQEEVIQFFRANMQFDTFTRQMIGAESQNSSCKEKYPDNGFVHIVSHVKEELAKDENEEDDLSPEVTELLQAFNSDEELNKLRKDALISTTRMHNAWLEFRMQVAQKAFKVLAEKTDFTFPQKEKEESEQDFSARLIEVNKDISFEDSEIIQWYSLLQTLIYQGTQIQRTAMHTICPHTRDTYALKDKKGNPISYRTPHKEIEEIGQSSITLNICQNEK